MRRAVLYGPPITGKSTLLKAFANSRGLALRSFDPFANVSRTVLEAGVRPGFSEAPPDRGIFVVDEEHHLRVGTIQGVCFNKNSWPTLLARADIVMLVLDPQIERLAANHECTTMLSAVAEPPAFGCVIWTKGDLAERGVEMITERHLDGRIASWPIYVSRHDDEASMLAPFDWLITKLRAG